MINLSLKEFKSLIPNYVIEIAETLQENNFEAYLVGGSVRDILLGIKTQGLRYCYQCLP